MIELKLIKDPATGLTKLDGECTDGNSNIEHTANTVCDLVKNKPINIKIQHDTSLSGHNFPHYFSGRNPVPTDKSICIGLIQNTCSNFLRDLSFVNGDVSYLSINLKITSIRGKIFPMHYKLDAYAKDSSNQDVFIGIDPKIENRSNSFYDYLIFYIFLAFILSIVSTLVLAGFRLFRSYRAK